MTRLDQIDATQLREGRAAAPPPGPADAMLRLLSTLGGVDDGLPVDQLTHALQTATRAERDGASDELVVAALCHDVAKALPHADHARLGAELLRPFVADDTYWILRTHQAFQARHFAANLGGNADARRRYRRAHWYPAAERFSDAWDQVSLDPEYDTEPLTHFEPRVRAELTIPRKPEVRQWRVLVGRVPGAQRAVHALRDRAS